MKIRSIIFSENIIDVNGTDNNGNVTLGKAVVNPVYLFTPKYIPSTFTFSALVMLQGDPSEFKGATIELIREGESITRMRFDSVDFPGGSILPYDNKKGLNIHVPFNNVEIKEEGTYFLRVSIDGNELENAYEEAIDFYRLIQ